MSGPLLTERVDEALAAIEAIKQDAGLRDKRVMDAERRADEAEERAEKDRKAKQKAEAKMGELEQLAVKAHADAGGEVARLTAEKEMLAERDKEARWKLEQIYLSTAYRNALKDNRKPQSE